MRARTKVDPRAGRTRPDRGRWREPESEARAPAPAVSRDDAKQEIESRLRRYIITEFAPWLADLKKWKDKRGNGEDDDVNAAGSASEPRPTPPQPIALQISTGVGKTHAMKAALDLCNRNGVPTLLLVPSHELANDYQQAGWFHYHGRAAVLTGEEKDWDCQKHAIAMRLAGQNHFPQSVYCVRHCENGRKWVLETASPRTTRYRRAEAWFAKHDINPGEVEPCRWQGHLRAAMHHKHVVAVSQSYSDSLAIWVEVLVSMGVDERDVPRLVIADEAAATSTEVAVALEDLAEWTSAVRDRIDEIQEATGDEGAIAALETVLRIFKGVAAWLGANATAEKSGPVPDGMRQAIAQIQSIRGIWDGATAAWEQPKFERNSDIAVPLRAARAILTTMQHGAGRTSKGKLHVVALTRLGEHLADRLPGILLDATLPPEVAAVIQPLRKNP